MLGSVWRRLSRSLAPRATGGRPVDPAVIAALFDQMDVGVVACDVAGRVTASNQFARALYSTHARTGEPVERWACSVDVFDGPGETPMPERLPLLRALREGPVRDLEFVIAAASGLRRRVLCQARPVRAADGAVLGAVAVLTDITGLPEDGRALRVAHSELQQANAELTRSVAELEAFAGAVSHDLKGPLVTVSGYVELLAQLDPVERMSAEYDEFVGKIADGATAMRTLIDDLLAFVTAPQARLHFTPVDLDALVHEVVAAHIDAGHLRGASRPQPTITVDPLPTVSADRAMLRQVIDNLVGNAVKYTPPGHPAQVHISGDRDPSGWVHLEVADRGIGIPDGEHDAVFASFKRAHRDAGYPGNGLGLTICRLIVERHGGIIGARPNPGGGTRFWLTLPASEGSGVPASQNPGRSAGLASWA